MRLVCLLAFLFASSAASQDAPETRIEKDPALATMLSVLITGGGQFYAGRTMKGINLFVVAAGAPVVGYLASETRTECVTGGGTYIVNPNTGVNTIEGGTRFCWSESDFTPLYVGLGVSAAMWLYGVATASSDARQYNARLGPSMMAGRPALSLRVSL